MLSPELWQLPGVLFCKEVVPPPTVPAHPLKATVAIVENCMVDYSGPRLAEGSDRVNENCLCRGKARTRVSESRIEAVS